MKKKRILILLLALVLLFIWGQSLLSRQTSATESSYVTKLLAGLFPQLLKKKNLVRKIAHVAEFAVLGAVLERFLCSAQVLREQGGLRRLLEVQGLGMLAALLDETVQLLSHRNALILDVWRDSLGVLLGIGSMLLIRFLKQKKKKANTSADV